jgi:type IV secretory pathway component VirB8
MTPFEFGLHIENYNRKTERESKEKITLAYMTAYWHRVEKMPSLQSILEPDKPKQNEEEMLAEIKKLNAKMGGKIY